MGLVALLKDVEVTRASEGCPTLSSSYRDMRHKIIEPPPPVRVGGWWEENLQGIARFWFPSEWEGGRSMQWKAEKRYLFEVTKTDLLRNVQQSEGCQADM